MTKYERHIRQLCKEHGIKIQYNRSDFSANPIGKIIWINRRLKSIKTYVSALHEIGHIINEPDAGNHIKRVLWQCDYGSFWRVSKHTFKMESMAWGTAKRLSKWWNFSADKVALVNFMTYWRGYNSFHKKPFYDINNRKLKILIEEIKRDEELVSLMVTNFFYKA